VALGGLEREQPPLSLLCSLLAILIEYSLINFAFSGLLCSLINFAFFRRGQAQRLSAASNASSLFAVQAGEVKLLARFCLFTLRGQTDRVKYCHILIEFGSNTGQIPVKYEVKLLAMFFTPGVNQV
jgi:hypothetical protein